MGVHMNAGKETEDVQQGELSLELVKKYIHYCRTYVLYHIFLYFIVIVYLFIDVAVHD